MRLPPSGSHGCARSQTSAQQNPSSSLSRAADCSWGCSATESAGRSPSSPPLRKGAREMAVLPVPIIADGVSDTARIHSEDAAMTTSPNLATESARRSAQNRVYAALALEHLDSADPTLAWLFPPGKPPRQKVLEELGRIAVLDNESCR